MKRTQNKKIEKLLITTYKSDYRDYLKDRFEFEKKQRKTFSFQFCASRLSTSKSYLKLVIEKKRQISLDKVPRLWSLFKLDPFEQQYFTILFLKTISEDQQLKDYFHNALGRLEHRLKYAGSYEGSPSAENKDSIFRGWLSMTIHSLVRLKGFKPEVLWIRDKLVGQKPSGEEIKSVLDELIKNGLIKKTGDAWDVGEFVFRTPDEFDKDQFKIYKIGVQKADQVLDDAYQYRPAHFHMMALSLNEEDRKKIYANYIEFRDKMIAISKESKDPDQVVFLSNNIFCVGYDPK